MNKNGSGGWEHDRETGNLIKKRKQTGKYNTGVLIIWKADITS